MRETMNVNKLAKSFFGITLAEVHEQKICLNCKEPATEFKDEGSRKEYERDGFCQTCQDDMFGKG